MEKKPAVCGRFAPSPSGRMHLGNLWSCLLAWLAARSQGGRMVLRLEDLDPDRCTQAWCDQVMRDLEWLGLDWDNEPVYQSRRTEAYRASFTQLEERGLIYPCYCTRAERLAASAPHRSDGVVIYDGRCRRLTPQERSELARTRRPAWRVEVPEETVSFVDRIQGPFSQNLARECGDFILRRSDGVFAYQLAENLIPQIGGFNEEGYTSEEMKMQNEGRKIMHLPELRVSCTCVRVPVVRSHSESITAEFERPISVDEARELLAAAPGVRLVDDPAALRYPMPLETSDQDLIWVGRVRRDLSAPEGVSSLTFWCCGDQIRKGAATNAVQIAEYLV